MAETVRPFHCGSQYGDWTESNCRRCTKGAPPDDSWPACDLEAALVTAYVGDGRIPLAIAERIGAETPEFRYVWPCGEWEPTEEWKAEWRRRHPEASR